jgi:hypothetical protein
MLKRLVLTALAIGIVSIFSLQTTPAEAVGMRGMTCKDAAKAKYPYDRAMRRAWRKLCVANWELHRGGY